VTDYYRILFDIRDRVVVVTGGMGQLGRQFASTLLSCGAKVAILDLRASRAELPENLANFPSDRLLALEADVTRRESLEAALAEICKGLGTPYGLVNNAALDSPPNAPLEENGPFETYPAESFRKVMDVNVTGVLLACQVFGGAMAEAGTGSIINIGSTYGMVSPDQNIYEYRRQRGEVFYKPVSYATSKSALLNLTRYLAAYWAKKGVRANLLAFGGVFNNQDPQFLANYCGRVPMGRMAREDEYNGAVVFLLSDASTYMTGADIVLDGGWTAI